MIHLVVALPAEASPLIKRLGLRREAQERPPKVYAGGEVRLVVSGVGKAAAGAAVTHLQRLQVEDGVWWVNLGIAAHRSQPLGELVRAEEIVDAGSLDVWRPLALQASDLPSATVCTVDRPQETLADDRLYEMEAAGFASAVSPWAPAGRVACLKVISDRGVESPGALTRQAVSDLIGRHLDRLEELFVALQ